MKDNAVSQIPDSKTIHDVGDNTNIGENQSHPLLYRLVNHILDPYALVGVVTNKYQYLTMKYNAVLQIPASKTIHDVGDNTNIGEKKILVFLRPCWCCHQQVPISYNEVQCRFANPRFKNNP